MTQLTKEEREAFPALGEYGLRQPDLPGSLRLVLPTPEARREYFALQPKPAGFFAADAKSAFEAMIGGSDTGDLGVLPHKNDRASH